MQDRLERAGATVEANQKLNQGDLLRYNAANQAAIDQVNSLTGEDLASYRGLIGRTQALDPFATYKSVGDYRTGVIDRAAAEIGKQGRAAQNLGFARLGFGGHGGSTYTDNAVVDRLTRNIAPAYLAALESVGRDSTALTAQEVGAIREAQSVIAARRALPFDTVPQWLNPINARNAEATDTIGLLGDVGGRINANTAGFIAKDNLTRRLGNAWSEAENTSINTGLSAFKAYMGQNDNYHAGGADSASKPNQMTEMQNQQLLHDTMVNNQGVMSGQGQGGYGAYGGSYPQYSQPVNFGTSGNYYNGGVGYTQPAYATTYNAPITSGSGNYYSGGFGYGQPSAGVNSGGLAAGGYRPGIGY